jgi:hypothetical protein
VIKHAGWLTTVQQADGVYFLKKGSSHKTNKSENRTLETEKFNIFHAALPFQLT